MSLPGQEAPQYKIPMLGDAAVGKTCLVEQMLNGRFLTNSRPNVGVLTVQVNVTVGTKQVSLSIWDTAGQETYRSLVPLYTRNSSLVMLVFDTTDKNTFMGVPKWLNYIRSELGLTCPVFLIANKVDLEPEVSIDEIKNFGSEFSCEVYFTSAVSGEGVKDLLQAIACIFLGKESNSRFGDSPNLSKAQSSGCC